MVFDKLKIQNACQSASKQKNWNHDLRSVKYVTSSDEVEKLMQPYDFSEVDFNHFTTLLQTRRASEVISATQKFRPLLQVLANLAPIIKHSGFREENERRIVIAPRIFDLEQNLSDKTDNKLPHKSTIKFRARNNKIVPHIEALKDNVLHALERVIVGPGVHSWQNTLAVKSLLDNNGINAEVTPSRIPFQQ